MKHFEYHLNKLNDKVDYWDLIINDSEVNNVSVLYQKIENVEYNKEISFGLRVIKDHKEAIISSNNLNKVDTIFDRALWMLTVSSKDPDLVYPESNASYSAGEDLLLFDHTDPSTEKLIEIARICEESGLEEKLISKSSGSSAAKSFTKNYFINSNKFEAEIKSTSFSFSTSLVAGEGDNIQTCYEYSNSIFFNELDEAENIGKIAAKKTIEKLNPQKAASGNFPVIFERRCASRLLRDFASSVNGKSIMRKTSYLCDRLEELVFSQSINIIDDPHRKKGFGSCYFDAEGNHTQKLQIVENGRLKNYLLDLKTSKKLGLNNNFNASRSPGGTPHPDISNFYIDNGSKTLKELMRDAGKGIYITELYGHGANITNGVYSQGAFGFYFENGIITHPVSQFTISGSLDEMFKSCTSANDLKFEFSLNSPSLLLENLTIAGS